MCVRFDGPGMRLGRGIIGVERESAVVVVVRASWAGFAAVDAFGWQWGRECFCELFFGKLILIEIKLCANRLRLDTRRCVAPVNLHSAVRQ